MDKQLQLFSATLESWLLVQRGWLKLEAVFAAPDIQRQVRTYMHHKRYAHAIMHVTAVAAKSQQTMPATNQCRTREIQVCAGDMWRHPDWQMIFLPIIQTCPASGVCRCLQRRRPLPKSTRHSRTSCAAHTTGLTLCRYVRISLSVRKSIALERGDHRHVIGCQETKASRCDCQQRVACKVVVPAGCCQRWSTAHSPCDLTL